MGTDAVASPSLLRTMKEEEEEGRGGGKWEGRGRQAGWEGGEMVRQEGERETLQRCGSSAAGAPHSTEDLPRARYHSTYRTKQMKIPAHRAHTLVGEELSISTKEIKYTAC